MLSFQALGLFCPIVASCHFLHKIETALWLCFEAAAQSNYCLFASQSVVDLISYLGCHGGLEVADVLCELPLAERWNTKERSPLLVHPLARYLSEEVLGDQKISRVAGAVT